MTVEEFIDRVQQYRDEIVTINNIKYPEYDPYINGFDDCIQWLEDNILLISEAV